MAEKTEIFKADVEKHLSLQARYRLKMMIEAINIGRKTEGKPPIETIEVEDYEYSPWFDKGKH